MPPAESPFAPAPASLYGQERLRTEYDQKAVKDASSNQAFLNTQMRSRLGFTAAPSEKVGIKFEIQDTRFFGSEPSTPATNPAGASIGNSKGLDLLQGYVTVTEGPVTAAIGRQKMSLGSGRFLSTLEWSPTSRSFDGASCNYNIQPGNLTGVAFLVRDSTDKAVDDRLLLTGLYYNHQLTANHQVDAFLFYDQSRLSGVYGGLASQNYDLVYLGERAAGRLGAFTYEEEFIWQGGEVRAGRDLTSAAFQVATRIGMIAGANKVNAGFDIMSGDDKPSDGNSTAYRASYYFAHAYYGWMDYFAVNPGYGVMDLRLDADIPLLPGPTGTPRVTLKPQYHFFLPQNAPSGLDDPYGQEADLELHLGIYAKSDIVCGAALFLPGKDAAFLPAAALALNQDSQPGYFLYFMPTFNF